MMETTALSGAALRLHLIQLFLPTAATPDAAVQAARAAYEFIEPPPPCVVDLRCTPAMDDLFAVSRGGMPEVVAAAPEVKPEIEPEPEAVPEPGTVKARLLELCRQGLELSEINAALGWSGSSASAKIATYKFSVLYREARARRRAEKAAAPRPGAEEQAAQPKQQEAKPPVKTEAPVTAKRVDQIIDKLHKPVLPEDRLRRADDPVLCPCDIETVENWMEGQGLKLTFEGAGIYTCEGSPMTAAQLVKRANKARKAVSLPAFNVRGI